METKPARIISDYQIVDHGIEHSDYFQGCGTAHTPYDHCVTGIGDNFAEAIEDALEMIAQGDNGPDDIDAFERQMLADERLVYWPETPSVSDDQHDTADCEDSPSLYYHVSIRWSCVQPENAD